MGNGQKAAILHGCEEICGLCSRFSKLSDEVNQNIEQGNPVATIIGTLWEKMGLAETMKEKASDVISLTRESQWDEEDIALLNGQIKKARGEIKEVLEKEEEGHLLLSKKGLKITSRP